MTAPTIAPSIPPIPKPPPPTAHCRQYNTLSTVDTHQNRRSQACAHSRSNECIAKPMLVVHQLHTANIWLRNCLLTRGLFVRNPRIGDTHKCTQMFLRGGIEDFNRISRLQRTKVCPGCLIGFSQRSARDGKDTNQEQDLSHTSSVPSLLSAQAYHQISPLRQENVFASKNC